MFGRVARDIRRLCEWSVTENAYLLLPLIGLRCSIDHQLPTFLDIWRDYFGSDNYPCIWNANQVFKGYDNMR